MEGGCVCVWAGRSQASASSLAAVAGLSQLVLAVGTGVTHLVRVLAHPDRRPVARVRLLGLKRAMHLGTVAAALRGRTTGRRRDRGGQRQWREGWRAVRSPRGGRGETVGGGGREGGLMHAGRRG